MANNNINIDYVTSLNKGAWTAEEDTILTQYIHKHGPSRWKSLATRSGLKRCGKSCRLRWLNYLRPDIKRGNISDAEEDLILRLQKLLGNRWSLIAGRLPGRTDNEIKNYWNAHLRKKAKEMNKMSATSITISKVQNNWQDDDDHDHDKAMDKTSGLQLKETDQAIGDADDQLIMSSDGEDDFSTKRSYGFDWVRNFLELEEDCP